MDKRAYNTMQNALENSHNNAWKFIFDSWHCNEWRVIPQSIKLTLGLHSALGMCNGMLITRTGASGSNEFIARLNNKSS